MFEIEKRALVRLIHLAQEDELIEQYRLSDTGLELQLAGQSIRLTYPHAYTFLCGLLGGRTWGAPYRGAASRGEAAPTVPFKSLLADATFDDLVGYARRLGLIEGATRNAATRAVVLHLKSCDCPLTQKDAVDYLTDCIQDALLQITRTSGPIALPDLMTARAPVHTPRAHQAAYYPDAGLPGN